MGPLAEAPPLPGAVRELPGLLLPGLVNTHCHTPMLLLRGMGGDLPLLRWLHEVMWPAEGRLTASDVRTGMVSGCVELLRTGTTTSVEMYFFTDAVIDAVLAVGSRVLLTPGRDRRARLGPARQLGGDAQRDLAAHRPRRPALRARRAGRAGVRAARGVHAAGRGAAVGRRARAGAGGAAAPAPGRDRGGGRGAARRARLGAGAAGPARGVRGPGARRARGAPVRRRHRAAGRARGGGGALPGVEREARGGRGAGVRAAPGGGAGGAGHGRPGVRATTSTCGPRPGSPGSSPG